MKKSDIKKIVTEELNRTDKAEIKKIISKEIEDVLKSKKFKDNISDILSKDIKKNKEFEKQVLSISKNVLIQLYKTFWVRRNLWANSLQNKPA